MNILKKILRTKLFMIGAAALLLYTLAGFFLVPRLVRHYVPKIVHDRLNKKASIGEVLVNPFTYTFEVKDFRIDEPSEEPIVGFERLFVDFEMKSVFRWAWTFRRVSLNGPHVHAFIAKDGALNLNRLVPPSEQGPQPPEKDQEPPPLIVEEILIDRGRIDFTDQRQSQPASISLSPLNLTINNLNTLPTGGATHALAATLGDGGTIRWTGEFGLNPLRSQGSLALQHVQTATAWKFIRDALKLEQPDGMVSITGDYHVDLSGAEPQVTVSKLAVILTGIALRLEGAKTPFFDLSDGRLTGGRADLAGKKIAVEKLALSGGCARIAVDESGTSNLGRIVREAKEPESTAGPGATGGPTKPWTMDLDALELSGFACEYQDHSRRPGLEAKVGEIKASTRVRMEAGEKTRVVVNDLGMTLSDFRAALAGEPQPELQIQRIQLGGGAYDLEPNTFCIEKVSLDGGRVDVKRHSDGAFNLILLAAPPKEGTLAREREEAAAEGHPFHFLAKIVALSGFQVKFTDLAVRPEAPIIHLEDVSVTLSNVDGKSPMTFDADLKVREGGRIKAGGTVDPSGPAVESEVQVAELGLTAFQPYVSRLATLDLQSGSFSTLGRLRHGIKASGARTAYEGGFDLENVRITESGGQETLVGWKRVRTDKLTLQLEPNRIEIGDLRVVQPIGKFIIEKDHTINLAKVVKSDPDAKKTESPEKAPSAIPDEAFAYRVRRILISEGNVDFADLSLITPFGTRIHEIKGVVAGASSVKNARAQIRLDGRVDDYGTANVDGELNTSDPKAFTNISLVFRNVEMSRLTPYSGKFAGRRIDSGKLSVELKYKIDKRQLAGDNQFVIERLTLGEKVESADAVNLPLDLALALLKDANGVIDLGLPVSGSLDSPEFSYGALIWKAVVNLLTKIVTSPFKALAALLPGGGEETLDTVAFQPGRHEVPPPEREKLAKLAGALHQRPQLRLVVQGRYNPESDMAELRTASLRRTLASVQGQKLEPGEDPGPVDYSSPETGKALETLFTERFGAEALRALKAEQEAALEKSKKDETAVQEDPQRLAKNLFSRLSEAETVDGTVLGKLADLRAQAIVAELTEVGQIPAERITVKPSTADDRKGSMTAALQLEATR